MDLQKEIDSLKVKSGYNGKPQQWQYGFDLACRELAKHSKQPQWISVEDSLPKEKKWVLIRVTCSDYFNVEQGMYLGDGKWMNCWCATRHSDLYPVTHWMPLLEPPTKECN